MTRGETFFGSRRAGHFLHSNILQVPVHTPSRRPNTAGFFCTQDNQRKDTMKIKSNKRLSQRGFMDPGSWGLVIGLVLRFTPCSSPSRWTPAVCGPESLSRRCRRCRDMRTSRHPLTANACQRYALGTGAGSRIYGQDNETGKPGLTSGAGCYASAVSGQTKDAAGSGIVWLSTLTGRQSETIPGATRGAILPPAVALPPSRCGWNRTSSGTHQCRRGGARVNATCDTCRVDSLRATSGTLAAGGSNFAHADLGCMRGGKRVPLGLCGNANTGRRGVSQLRAYKPTNFPSVVRFGCAIN